GTVTIMSSTIARNVSDNQGGGIGNSEGALTIVNSAIVGNGAGDGPGGGVVNNGGGVIIRNSTLARNISQSGLDGCGGGAIANLPGFSSGMPPGTVSLTNSTLAENVALGGPVAVCNGGGIFTVSGAAVLLQNTLLAHNTVEGRGSAAPGRGPDCFGVVTSVDNNLIGDPTDCTIPLHRSDLTGDPGLDAFTDDGTPGNGHFPLLPTSQAIDAANDAVCPRRDQLGQRRVNIPGVGTSRCDIGAIEFHAPDDPTDSEDPAEAFRDPEDQAP